MYSNIVLSRYRSWREEGTVGVTADEARGVQMEILTDWMGPAGAGQILSRWGHYLAGVTWIGLLYYFNFVQVPAFAELSDAARSEAIRSITKRALWWFRFGALLTFLTGVLILGFQRALGSEFTDYFSTAQGTSIAFGAVLGTTMFLNVWLVIWPAQKIVIGSAESVAAGGDADPEAAAAGKRAGRASRCNTLFSIPMLFFMAATSHWVASRVVAVPRRDERGAAWVVFIIIVGVIELSALGQVGGYDSLTNKALFDDHRKTIAWGFILWAILYIGGFEVIIAGKIL
jgi:hypothetical protein